MRLRVWAPFTHTGWIAPTGAAPRFPARVFLNRGNHEFAGVNREMGAVGFEAACARLGSK